MVCAICGRMPLMMQSAPIRRAAATVFSRCCATSVSTVGTPVMSMMAMRRAGAHDRLQQAFHHHLRARAVERADERQREDAVPQLHDGRRELQQLLLLAGDHLFAALLEHLGGVERELVEHRRGGPDARQPAPSASRSKLAAQAREQRLLERQARTSRFRSARSPVCARERETAVRKSRTGAQSSELGGVRRARCAAPRGTARGTRATARAARLPS